MQQNKSEGAKNARRLMLAITVHDRCKWWLKCTRISICPLIASQRSFVCIHAKLIMHELESNFVTLNVTRKDNNEKRKAKLSGRHKDKLK